MTPPTSSSTPSLYLCPLNTFPWSCSGWKLFSLCPGCGSGRASEHRAQLHLSPKPRTRPPPTPTHPSTEVDLEDRAVTTTAEHVMLSQVHGHGHDAHVEEHRQQQLAGGDLPQLGAGTGAWV